MGLKAHIVHQYFKKEMEDGKVLLKVNPIHLTGLELIVHRDGKLTSREIEVGEAIAEELKAEAFVEVNGMEFNLLLSGLIK